MKIYNWIFSHFFKQVSDITLDAIEAHTRQTKLERKREKKNENINRWNAEVKFRIWQSLNNLEIKLGAASQILSTLRDASIMKPCFDALEIMWFTEVKFLQIKESLGFWIDKSR